MKIGVKYGIFLLIALSVYSGDSKAQRDWKKGLKTIIDDNRKFVRKYGTDYFAGMIDAQSPYATVVSCVDSRVHTHAFDQMPDNDIFMIRSLGNQIGNDGKGTCERGLTTGAVDYGIRVLRTPLLIIIGHDKCGAVKAASSDKEMADLAKNPFLSNVALELRNMQAALKKGQESDSSLEDRVQINIIKNIHYQVSLAQARYADLVAAGKLKIIGALYDLAGSEDNPPPGFGRRYGRLIIKNINGEKDPRNLQKMVEEISPSYEKIGDYSQGELPRSMRK